ncbi:MAG: sporulation protein YtxC [Clostridia bacterium]
MTEEITDIIMEEYESQLIDYFIKTTYPFLDENEKTIVKDYAMEERKENYHERRKMVKGAVWEFLRENREIVPKGFVDFRLREMYKYAEKFVFLGAERFFNQKEYEEFINLLSLFIEEREPKEKLLHVIWDKGVVRLLNKRGRDVTEKYQAEFINAAKECDAKSEDLAVSAIISVAPEKVVLHLPPEASPLSSTLKKIFKENAYVCTGCNMCKRS